MSISVSQGDDLAGVTVTLLVFTLDIKSVIYGLQTADSF